MTVRISGLLLIAILLLAGCDSGADISTYNGGGNDKGSGALGTPLPSDASDVQVNTVAPDFTLPDASGKQYSLAATARTHKLTIVNFWASWCPPCRAEMPDLADAYAKYRDKGLAILGVNYRESLDQVKQYAADGGFTWPLLLTTNDDLRNSYRAMSMPSTYFVDGSGKIVHVVRGAMNSHELTDQLARFGFN